jgi:hypothetical protein
MKRIVWSSLCAGVVVLLVGVAGCGGGGPSAGMPEDTTVSPEMRDQMKSMTDMSKVQAPGVTPAIKGGAGGGNTSK